MTVPLLAYLLLKHSRERRQGGQGQAKVVVVLWGLLVHRKRGGARGIVGWGASAALPQPQAPHVRATGHILERGSLSSLGHSGKMSTLERDFNDL